MSIPLPHPLVYSHSALPIHFLLSTLSASSPLRFPLCLLFFFSHPPSLFPISGSSFSNSPVEITPYKHAFFPVHLHCVLDPSCCYPHLLVIYCYYFPPLVAYMDISFHAPFFYYLFFVFLPSPASPLLIFPLQLFLFFFLFLPIVIPMCTLSVASFQFFSSSFPPPMFPPALLPRIFVRIPRIVPLFWLVLLRSNMVRCDQLKNKSNRRVTYGQPCYSIGSKANLIYFLNDRSVLLFLLLLLFDILLLVRSPSRLVLLYSILLISCQCLFHFLISLYMFI
jgi:hypothetical protein